MKTFHYKQTSIVLIQVNDGVLVRFNSALEKQAFISQHLTGTYELCGSNYAVEYLYLVIDLECTGFVLNRDGITYNRAIDLIEHYL